MKQTGSVMKYVAPLVMLPGLGGHMAVEGDLLVRLGTQRVLGVVQEAGG